MNQSQTKKFSIYYSILTFFCLISLLITISYEQQSLRYINTSITYQNIFNYSILFSGIFLDFSDIFNYLDNILTQINLNILNDINSNCFLSINNQQNNFNNSIFLIQNSFIQSKSCYLNLLYIQKKYNN